MAIFTFDTSHLLGRVRAVDTRRVDVQVNSDEDLRKARVGQLLAISLPGAIEQWLIGIIDRVVKTPVIEVPSQLELEADEESDDAFQREGVLNTVRVSLVGTAGLTLNNEAQFSRSLAQVPEIDATCNILRDAQLQAFMALLSAEGKMSIRWKSGDTQSMRVLQLILTATDSSNAMRPFLVVPVLASRGP